MAKKGGIHIKDPNMKLSEKFIRFFLTLINSFNPTAYRRFSEKRFSQLIRYFFGVFVLALVLFLVFSAIKLPGFVDDVSDGIEKMSKLELSVDMDLPEDVNLLEGKIRISENGNYSGETFFISESEIVQKNTYCLAMPFLCLFKSNSSSTKDTEELKDVLKHKQWFMNLLLFISIVLLPLFVLMLGFGLLLSTLFFVAVFSLLVFLLSKVLNYRLSYQQIYSIPIYASTIYMLGCTLDFMLSTIFNLHILLFFVYSIVAVFLVGSKKQKF